VIICAACARTFRIDLAVVPVPWSVVVETFEHRPHDLLAFEWMRNGVRKPEPAEAIAYLQRTKDKFPNVERAAVGVVLALVVASILTLLRVHS
jgi:hypothetical protein